MIILTYYILTSFHYQIKTFSPKKSVNICADIQFLFFVFSSP